MAWLDQRCHTINHLHMMISKILFILQSKCFRISRIAAQVWILRPLELEKVWRNVIKSVTVSLVTSGQVLVVGWMRINREKFVIFIVLRKMFDIIVVGCRHCHHHHLHVPIAMLAQVKQRLLKNNQQLTVLTTQSYA